VKKQPDIVTTQSVLIVDDDAMVRVLARSSFSQLNLEVYEVENGAEAVALFEQRPFDLVLLDLEMPVMDGFSACTKIRTLPGGDTATLIVVTGLDDANSIQRSYELGATDFVTKPINWSILTQRMRFILRAREAFQALQENQAKLSESQKIANLGHWEWDVKNNQAEWSDQLYMILGKAPETCRPSYASFLQVVHPQDRAMVNRAIGYAVEKVESYSLEHRILLSDGVERNVISQGRALSGVSGQVLKVRSVVQDVTERKQAEDRIYHLAYYDNLTGLPNRDMFKEYASRLLNAAQRDGTKAAVILMDLDRFKRINDSLGHNAGDELLKEVATRINNCVRQSDLIAKLHNIDDLPYSLARPGGDEFMLLVRGLERTEGVANFVQRLLNEMSQPVFTKEHEIYVSASIGIALFPSDGEQQDTLLSNADIALGHAKEAGGGCFRFYAKEMNQWANERINLEARLNRAIENDELQLYYQPQISLINGQTVGFEALLRWQPEGGKLIPPNDFIPIAEETGLILDIGAWVLNRACQQLKSWQTQGYSLVPVAVNLSARQFTEQDLVKMIVTELNSADLSPELLELELTERVIMRDVEENRIKLQSLKDIGVKLSVDDFGTGYSSMNYLKRFPLDVLKIDRSFVKDLESDTNDEAIIRAIVALSKGLGLTTIAEGVETEQQRQLLRSIGCDLMQGYLVSRPVPAEAAASFLATSLARLGVSEGGS
jgi:diguanylate cyclase (GGDEF)-like protein/PAS domain S-box-containing protein